MENAKIWNPHVIFLGQQENLQFLLMNLNEILVKSSFLTGPPIAARDIDLLIGWTELLIYS